MNPFRPLLKLLDFVLGHDLHEREAEQRRPAVKRPPTRAPAPQGDGFDSGSRGPQVDLRGGVKTAPMAPDEPAGPPAVIEPTDFNASLEDLSHVIDEPMEPKPEFVPEGGMSTESLMSEFESLDAETKAAAVELAAAKELALQLELENPEKFIDAFEPSPAAPTTIDESVSLSLRSGERVGVRGPLSGEAQTTEEPKLAAPLDFSHVVDDPLPPKPEFIPAGGMSTESLMSEFESLDPDTQAAAVEEAAANELARARAEAEAEAEAKDSFEPSAPEPQQPKEVLTPAWLIPATAAAPKPAAPLPPPELSTESLMSEFESLDADTQAAAIEEAAAKELARQEAEEAAKEQEEASAPEPPAPMERMTPAWLIPATAPAPKPAVPLPPPELSTESLMSEFESLDSETREAAIAEAAAKEQARQEAEEAKRAREQAESAESAPLTAPQGAGDSRDQPQQGEVVQTPGWLLPATSAPPPKPVVPVSTGFDASVDDLEGADPHPDALADGEGEKKS